MEIMLPKLPKYVGIIIRQHETPGHHVEDGGKIISIASLVADVPNGNETLFTTTQMKQYAFDAIMQSRHNMGLETEGDYFI